MAKEHYIIKGDEPKLKKIEKDDDIVRYAENLIEYGKRGMKNSLILVRRDKSIAYYKGDHKIKLRSERQGNQVWNKYAQIAQNRRAHIIAKQPKWKFLPRQENATFGASALNSLITDYLWDKIEWDDKGEESINEAFDAGSSHIKLFFNRETKFPDAEPIPANAIIIDPKAKKKKIDLRLIGLVLMGE